MVDKDKHRKATISGIKWNMLSQVVSLGLLFLVGILLMRFLTPAEFGLMGMVNVFSGFLFVLGNFGIASSLIQSKEIDELDKDTVFWFSLLINGLLAVLLIGSSPFIASFYNEAKLISIASVMSFVFVLQSIGSIHNALLRKHLEFKKLFINNTVSGVLAAIISITAALQGMGVWALVLQQVCTAFFATVLYWINDSYRPGFSFSKERLKKHLKFGLPLLGSHSFQYWIGNGDNLLIGKFLGVQALGIYSRAYSIVTLPTRRFNIIFTTVLFPSFSQIKDDKERVKTIYLKAMRVIAFFILPGMGLLVVIAKPFISLLAGDTWSSMVPILQLLAVVAGIKSLGFLTSNILLSQGQSGIDFRLNTFSSLFTLLGFFIGVQFGMLEVGYAYLIASIVTIPPGWYLAGKQIQCGVSEVLLNVFLLVLIAGSLTILGIFTVSRIEFLPAILQVFFASLGFTLGWILLTRLFYKKISVEVLGLVKDTLRIKG
jgi:O-antigen/teichoic acid export membrane protein